MQLRLVPQAGAPRVAIRAHPTIGSDPSRAQIVGSRGLGPALRGDGVVDGNPESGWRPGPSSLHRIGCARRQTERNGLHPLWTSAVSPTPAPSIPKSSKSSWLMVISSVC